MVLGLGVAWATPFFIVSSYFSPFFSWRKICCVQVAYWFEYPGTLNGLTNRNTVGKMMFTATEMIRHK